MRTFLAILVSVLCSISSAQTIVKSSGKGQRSGYCYGVEGGHCVNDLADKARLEAIDWAVVGCSGKVLKPIEPSCQNVCNPSYFPPNGPDQYVNCRSECEIDCEI